MTPLDYPFDSRKWPRAITYPNDFDGGDSLRLSWDPSGSIDESERKKIIRDWIAILPTLSHLKRLSLWTHVTQPVFEAACEIKQLHVFQIKWSNITDLSPISALKDLRALSIGSSTRVQSIGSLAELHALKLLELENFKLITDFSPLTHLRALEDLAITGGMWSQQTVDSLEPIASMSSLTSLAIDTSSILSLRPLARMTGLRHLGLSGRMPFDEYAWLSVKLPRTACSRFAPFIELSELGHSACVKCQQHAMVMVTGKGKPTLCKSCDAAKLAKHVAQFEAARALARCEV